ncbi:MAG: hypothetical protein ACIALR_13605 [Blastopirellula sp. JB062]
MLAAPKERQHGMDQAADPRPVEENAQAAPILSERYALSAFDFVVVVVLVAAYLAFYYLPLPTAGVWRDIVIGREILSQSQIPAHPPLMPLAEASPYRATSWLADISLALIDRAGGPAAISLAGTLLAVGYLLFVYFVLCRRSLHPALKLIALVLSGLTLLFDWQGINPALASIARFAVFLAPLALQPRWRQADGLPTVWMWLISPLAIIAWVNTHSTFIAGPLLAVALALGVAADVFQAKRSLGETLGDRRVQAWSWWAQLCLLVSLLNPWGFSVWSTAISQIASPLDGSGPLVIFSPLGGIVAFGVIAYAYLLRRSPVTVYGADVAMFVVAAALAACNTHFVLLYVAAAIVVCLPLASGVFADAVTAPQPVPASADNAPRSLRFAYTLLSLLAVWIGFALSPISAYVLGGTPRPIAKTVADPPQGVIQYLHEHSQPRFMFAPVLWSDWIGYSLNDSPRLFVTSDFELLPQQVKYDYRRLIQGKADWKRVLDRYAIDTLIIDKTTQADFAIQAVGEVDAQWSLAWENDRALILQRRID